MKTLFNHIIINVYLSLLVVAGAFCSCTDEVYQELDFTVSGKDVELTIPIRMPEMDVKTRSAISDVDCSVIKSLWIAVFDASGRITSQKKDGTTGWYVVDVPDDYTKYQEHFAPEESSAQTVTLKTKSGPSYIVAVANVDNKGVMAGNLTEKPLRELLKDQLTWEEFNKIAVVSFSGNTGAASDLDAPNVTSGLPMSGCFSSLDLGGTHPDDWSVTNFKPVTIPSSGNGKASLDGAIHLRRLVSHITFNLIADGSVVDLSVEGYKIFNAPNYSWLYERGTAEHNSCVNLGSNFGDQATDPNDAKTYYHAPVSFPSHYITTTQDEGNKTHSFNFWMVENKHTGSATTYNDREVKANPTDEYPLYTALTGDTWTSNNQASYVTIYCNVTYKKEPTVDDNGNITEDGSSVYRMGVVEYTIHLGYIGDKTVDEVTKARDFNSYRNTDYTYNIKVKGLNEIVVEANHGDERNSAEGVVTDVENPTILLDAHYACFNVVFTEEELTDIDNFGYLITTYESGSSYTYTETDVVPDEKKKYIDWIELKPTKDATTLAKYCPAKGDISSTGQTEEDRVLPIDKFYEKVKKASEANEESGKLEKVFPKADGGNYYFTVFVNEYTYEPRYGDEDWGKENGKNNWRNYVNQPTRHFYFRVRRRTSKDENSVYARSKYAIAQQSIQTYYSTDTEKGSSTAIGVEHINELQGLNLRSSFKNGNSKELSDINGRWNVDQWLNETDQKREWSNFLQSDKMLQIPDISQDKLQGGPGIVSLESGWNPASGDSADKGFTYLCAPKAYTGSYVGDSRNRDPQENSGNSEHYVEAINSCMNRNRDENGNGIIDNQELKWYVPASGKYLRAILGRNSLEDPIMPYGSVTKLPNTDNAYNTRYLMYASNNKIIWAMEGTSMSDWAEKSGAPWNVRCIRNLGTDLTTVDKEDKVKMAYIHDEEHRRVIMTYYDQASIRTEKITKAGNTLNPTPGGMHLHPVTDPLNKVYYAFEYTDKVYSFSGGTPIYPMELWSFITTPDPNGNDYNKSSSLGSNWRIPNQKEVTIMRNLGLFNAGNIGTDNYAVSCTYDFFDTEGKGTDQGTPEFTASPYPNHHMMGVRWDAGTRIAGGSTARMYYRCVRDVDVDP